ncbi:MAG TPA: YdcF family protein [Waterburya sp.]|jgi:uncharacterized SAM-binding protein YcdF (DUF218 family)
MFDSNLCDRTIGKVSVYDNSWQLQWLNKPLLFLLLFLFIVWGIHWILKNPSRRRWLRSPKGFLLLFGVTALLPLFVLGANQSLTAFLPSDPGTPADAIVVLGRGWPLMHDRVNTTAELWQAKRAPKIFASGRKDAPNLIELLEEKGIPQQVLDGENCSLTTDENAVFTAAILQPQGIRRIILVTDKAHMLRSLLVYRAYGFKVIPHISPVPVHWNPKERGLLKVREYGGIFNYGVRGLFFPQRLSDLKSSELLNLVKEAEQYGQKQQI